jgi:hypothetical protein
MIFIPEPCKQAKAAIGTSVTAIDEAGFRSATNGVVKRLNPDIARILRSVAPAVLPFSLA